MLAQTWRIGKGAEAPRVGVHFDYASGGGGYGEGKLRNAYAPFGNNIYYSYALFLTPSNLIAVAPNVAVSPVKRVRLTGEYQLTWRDDTRDAVYRANGQPFAGTRTWPPRDRRRGAAPAAMDDHAATVLHRALKRVSSSPARRWPGYVDSDFLAGWLSFRF
ncbi:alginate export family protein [Sphingomonas sp. MMS24-JH45]